MREYRFPKYHGLVILSWFVWAGFWTFDPHSVAASVDFATDIKPILRDNCLKCHGPEKRKGGLRLDSREIAFAGGDSGDPAVVPGDSAGSQLIELVEWEEMPPEGDPLTPDKLELLKRWIDAGAAWPDSENVVVTEADMKKEMVVTDDDRNYWAFLPLMDAEHLPTDGNLVDAFFKPDGTLEEASRRTLIRRLYFDLIGLPPPPGEATRFVNGSSEDDYEKLVDALLGNPHFGERWAGHWLDVARYAESDGYESDRDRPEAWPYRDWVIRAFNDDLPFDTFLKWQLAGDEYEPVNPDAVVATGFLSAGPRLDNIASDTEENRLKSRYDELDDIVSTTSSAFMGLTVACARCHDHKYDPIPTRDYYRMVSAFSASHRQVASLSKPKREFEAWKEERRAGWKEAKMNALNLTEEEKYYLRWPYNFSVSFQKGLYELFGDELKIDDEGLFAWLSFNQQETWKVFENAVESSKFRTKDFIPELSLVMLDDRRKPAPEYLLERGDVTSRSEPVALGFLQVLSKDKSANEFWLEVKPERFDPSIDGEGYRHPVTTYQRKALAEWMVDTEQGAGALVARVLVNRFWQYHFGRGFTDTPNDIGIQGGHPRNPGLLEALARSLVDSGWSMKRLHKEILMSAAYRAENRRPLRLEAEILRDGILAVSGRLNEKKHGPSFRPIIPAEAMATRSKDPYPTDLVDGPELWRRSIYAFRKRSVPNPMMEVFDSPDPTSSCGRRSQTTIPTQALILLNNEMIRENAREFAKRVLAEVGDNSSRSAQIERAYQLALGRGPSQEEYQKVMRFFDSKTAEDTGRDPIAELTDLCHVLFTLNEFVYID